MTDTALRGVALADDWTMLLGSPFGNHACSGKSRSHPQDIRTKLIALEAQKARRYPVSDLIPAKKTLAQVLGRVRMNGIFDPNTYIKTITLVGVGGTGASTARIVARILYDMQRSRQHTPSLVLIDPDRVEEKNIGRQALFAPSDIGQFKAECVARRLERRARFGHRLDTLKPIDPERHADRFGSSLVISCVDNHEARRAVHRMKGILIAGGNHANSGQVCLRKCRRSGADAPFH